MGQFDPFICRETARWTTDANDERLLRFYDSTSGQQNPGKLFYRLDGDALKPLAS
ncbi:hypothetical protein [Roseibium litorale]|uniref:Uncharacterized protein n=1 Tax=Roseibium litorale TaxID=2803841 RepID=A0ABR9CQX4_9HYPH|nr:hypothetical protein [Roseibium litorale]MBD8892661.1 hypothetical protein [Roseibium litorale]